MSGVQAAPLWQPANPQNTPIFKYREHVNSKFNLNLRDSQELHKWSIEKAHDFWIDLWSYVGLKPALPPGITHAYDPSKSIKDIPEFFLGVELNYTENVLTDRDPNGIALIGLREGDPLDGEQWTWAHLTENVRKVRSALVHSGVERGDRVGALMSNSNWAIAIFLATASMGAVFSSVSSEMGTEGCVSRFKQIDVKVLFADSHQTYKAKRRSLEDKIKDTLAALKTKPVLAVLPVGNEGTFGLPSLDDFLARSRKEDALEYVRIPFSAPMLILFSSGTTGDPKWLVYLRNASPILLANNIS
jgi:acetoacetyl-CoA synthetase